MVSIDTNADKVAAAVDILSRNLHDTIVREGIWRFLEILKTGAKQVHRHQRRTGKLERSIKRGTHKDGGSVFVDDSYCDYGKFVHMGQRSWKPDQYVFDSFARNERLLDQMIDKVIDDAFRKAGL